MWNCADELLCDLGFINAHAKTRLEILVSTPYGPEWRAAARVAVALVETWVYVATEERLPMSEPRLSFKEMCATFDVTPRTLRYYEYIELINPEREGRSRFYGPKEIARMTLILRGRKFGFALEEIRQWLLIYEHEGTEAQMRAWIDLADRQLVELAEQKTQLEETMQELLALRDETIASLS